MKQITRPKKKLDFNPHAFLVSGTFFTEAILPTLTHEDPRYYTLGKNGFFKRASHAFSRSFITRNDRGTDEFNISEIGGNASEAALSNRYYRLRTRPRQIRQKLLYPDDYHCERQCP